MLTIVLKGRHKAGVGWTIRNTAALSAERRISGSPVTAFSLLELLVVVAILGILALIAIPNFMEASTRSKVARVRSDLRNAAAALESYASDRQAHYRPSSPTYNQWVGLTTPVAYLTSADTMLDPFGPRRSPSLGPPYEFHYFYSPYSLFSRGKLQKEKNDYYLSYYGGYSIDSVGPSRQEASDVVPGHPNWPRSVEYDPSNGANSVGHIIRSQKSAGR